MSERLEQEVTQIEGIGAATQKKLAALGISRVSDLLHFPASQIRGAVASASREQVVNWQRMAFLLQVDGVTPQWAEALVKAGADTCEKLARRNLSDLTQLFATAESSGLIPDVPSTEQLATMMADAAVISHTGVIAGRVVDGNGSPVFPVKVQRGGRSTETNAGGRFRLYRLRLGVTMPLVFTHDAHTTLHVADPEIVAVPDMVTSSDFVMHAGTPQPLAHRSELAGDEIRLAPGADVRERLVTASPPQDALLVMRRRYQRYDAVKLVSRLLVAEGETIYVEWYRVPSDELPQDVRRGDHFLYRDFVYSPVDMSAEGVRRYKIKRRMRAHFAGRVRDNSLLDEEIAYLTQAGYFNGRKGAR